MNALQPRSTLFPYTTLFRSVGRVGEDLFRHVVLDERAGAVLEREEGRHARNTRRLDRKSTRLNSSHRCISYAVFCLNKKKHDLAHPGRHGTTGYSDIRSEAH